MRKHLAWLLIIGLVLSGTLAHAQDAAYLTAWRAILEARETTATTLDLSYLDLTTVPPEIGQLSGLQELKLVGNALTALPPEIGLLSNLQNLYLSYNHLTTLPPEIGQLSSLQTLDLLENPLTTPPPEVVAQGTQAVLAYLREQGE
jgi:Leucine-rich repeat (LRR) protein